MDYKRFTDIMGAIAGNFSSTIEPGLLNIWHKLMRADGITYEQLRAAALKIIRTKKDSYGRMPTYAEILEAIQGEQPAIEDVALVEANKILDHLRINGAGIWPNLSDPITRQLMTTRWYYPRWAANCVESHNHWWVKDFVEAYRSTNLVDGGQGLAQISGQVRPLLEMVGMKVLNAEKGEV
jgi:hypothetical protein